MNRKRWVVGWLMLAALLESQRHPAPASGQEGETAGVITEMKIGRGRIELKPAGSPDWHPAGPLLALRAGDAVRATEDASAVILLIGGRGMKKLDSAGSVFIVPAPQPVASRLQKALDVLKASLEFLMASGKEPLQGELLTRAPKPPVIVSPRNGPVLSNSLTFEWLGSERASYTVRILGPVGVVMERRSAPGSKFHYPPGAPPLIPGVRYTVQVVTDGHPPQHAWFELVDPGRAQAIRSDLLDLQQGAGPTVFPNTLALIQAGFLGSKGLFHDARLTLMAALAKDPDEPTLHLLLSHLYDKTDLTDLAARAYDHANWLSSGSRNAHVPARP